VRLAERVTHEQAAQNKRLGDATKSLAQGSQQLVAAEAKARQEVIAFWSYETAGFTAISRWCRFAQPPANCYQASGLSGREALKD
jgi:hypothetical protein